MTEHEHGSIPSRITILDSPVHPLMINFPTTFAWSAALADTAFALTKDPFWRRAADWLVRAEVATAAPAATTGLVDFLLIDKARKHLIAWVHLLGMDFTFTLGVINWWQRRRSRDGGHGLSLALSWMGALSISLFAYFGGKLAHVHGISVGKAD